MTTLSFLLSVGKTAELPASVFRELFPYQDRYTNFEIPYGNLYCNGAQTEPCRSSVADTVLFVFGSQPQHGITRCSAALEQNDLPALQEAAAEHVVVAVKEDRLWIVRGEPGTIPVFIMEYGPALIISTELKPLCSPELPAGRRPNLSAPEYFELQPYYKPVSQTPLEGATRLEAGAALSVDLNTMAQQRFAPLKRGAFPHRDVGSASRRLHDLLTDRIRTAQHTSKRIGIPLSGGYDSGCIAAIASAQPEALQTFTIGTELVNEFEGAREMAGFVGSKHREFIIREADLLPAIVHGIWLNELNDPVYAEGYSGLYFVFREASEHCDTLLTGYGADLTLGNFRQVAEQCIAEESDRLVRRAGRTGELSPYVAAHFGLRVHQPFLSKEIVDFIVSMPPEFKVRDGTSKYIEREMIRAFGLMPDALMSGPKRALHTGAGIDRLFVKLLGVDSDPGYRLRSAFLYGVWKDIIFDHTPPDSVDMDRILRLARRQAGI